MTKIQAKGYKTQEEELLEQIEGLAQEGQRRDRWSGVKVVERMFGSGLGAGAVITLFNYLVPPWFKKEKEFLWEPRNRTNLFIVTPAGYPYVAISNFWTEDIFRLEYDALPYCTNQVSAKRSSYWGVPIGAQFWGWQLQSYRPIRDTLIVYEKVVQRRLLLKE